MLVADHPPNPPPGLAKLCAYCLALVYSVRLPRWRRIPSQSLGPRRLHGNGAVPRHCVIPEGGRAARCCPATLLPVLRLSTMNRCLDHGHVDLPRALHEDARGVPVGRLLLEAAETMTTCEARGCGDHMASDPKCTPAVSTAAIWATIMLDYSRKGDRLAGRRRFACHSFLLLPVMWTLAWAQFVRSTN